MPSVASPPTPSTSVVEVRDRLSKVESALRQSTAADGSIDLTAARQRVGADAEGARLLHRVQDYFSSGSSNRAATLTADQGRQAVENLQRAAAAIDVCDSNQDGRISEREVALPSSPAVDLLSKAAAPRGWVSWDYPAPKSAVDVAERRALEARVEALATHHAAIPLGAEALKWSMRLSLVTTPWLVDAEGLEAELQGAESDWRASVPILGGSFRDEQGHLSDAEIREHLGTSELKRYIDQTRARVNAALLLDYEREYLAGSDLP